MKILITGSTGLLGQALSARLAQRADVTGLSRHAPTSALAGRHVVCDLRDAGRTAEAICAVRPDVVLHAQALPDVDRCEREPTLAEAMNVGTTAHVIDALAGTRAWLMFISTDYVFDGTKGSAYEEADAPQPLNVYGRTKLAAERLILSQPRGLVARVSTLFGAGRKNFCDEIVERLRRGDVVEAFSDQTTSPTYTEDVAEGLDLVLRVLECGALPSKILHVVNDGSCTRVAFANRVAELIGSSRSAIRAIPMAQQRRPAPRPAHSALRSRYLATMIGRTLRPWDDALQAYLRQRRPFDSAQAGVLS